VNLDSPLQINEEQIVGLRDMVLDFGKYMLVVPKDRVQDGDDMRAENESVQALLKERQTPPQE